MAKYIWDKIQQKAIPKDEFNAQKSADSASNLISDNDGKNIKPRSRRGKEVDHGNL